MRAVVLAAVLVLAAPSAAIAATTWKGKTAQGRGVIVHADDEGIVDGVKIGWRARCRHGVYRSRTVFMRPLDRATARAFEDGGTYRARPGRYRARLTVRIAGSLREGRWRGTFRVRVRVTKDGEHVDTCRLRRLRWSAGQG